MAVELRRPRIWPLELRDGALLLRPLRRGDARRWRALRNANLEWLAPWEATHPGPERAPTFGEMVSAFTREARAGRMLPFAIELNGALVGQVTVSAITWGSMRSGHIGYWIDRSVAGRGLVPNAVAMVCDYCFLDLGLHRLEVNIRPENVASLRVVEKLGFRPEGIRRAFLHIDGDWRDHATFALTAAEMSGGMVAKWRIDQRVRASDDAAKPQ